VIRAVVLILVAACSASAAPRHVGIADLWDARDRVVTTSGVLWPSGCSGTLIDGASEVDVEFADAMCDRAMALLGRSVIVDGTVAVGAAMPDVTRDPTAGGCKPILTLHVSRIRAADSTIPVTLPRGELVRADGGCFTARYLGFSEHVHADDTVTAWLSFEVLGEGWLVDNRDQSVHTVGGYGVRLVVYGGNSDVVVEVELPSTRQRCSPRVEPPPRGCRPVTSVERAYGDYGINHDDRTVHVYELAAGCAHEITSIALATSCRQAWLEGSAARAMPDIVVDTVPSEPALADGTMRQRYTWDGHHYVAAGRALYIGRKKPIYARPT